MTRQPSPGALAFARKVGQALREAVDKVVEDHRRTGRPLVVSENGKVVLLPPDQATSAFAAHESRVEYGADKCQEEK